VYYFNANSHLIHPNEWAQLIQANMNANVFLAAIVGKNKLAKTLLGG
jgi:hypothetical protein